MSFRDTNMLVAQYLQTRFPETFSAFVKEADAHRALPTSIFSEHLSQEQLEQMLSVLPQNELVSLTSQSAPRVVEHVERKLTLSDQLLNGFDCGRRESFDSMSEVYGHEAGVFCTVFDQTGQILITGSDDETVKVWKVPSLELLLVCDMMNGAISNISVHPGNELCAVSSLDQYVRIFRMPDFQMIKVIEVQKCAWAGFSRTGKYLAAIADDRINVWDCSTLISASELLTDVNSAWMEVAMPQPNWPVENLSFSPADEFLVLSTHKGILAVVDLVTRNTRMFDVHTHWLDAVGFANCSCEMMYSLTTAETYAVLTYSEKEMLDSTCRLASSHHEKVRAAEFTRNDMTIVVLYTLHVVLFNTLTHEPTLKLQLTTKSWQLRTHSLLPGICAIASDNGTLELYDLDEGKIIQQLEPMTGCTALDLSFSAHGQSLAMSDATGRVVIYGSWPKEFQFSDKYSVQTRPTRVPPPPSEQLYHQRFHGAKTLFIISPTRTEDQL